VRNREHGAGHGAPPDSTEPDAAVAEYAVNMAGSSIVFLVRQWKNRGAGDKGQPR
jgi:hypothetical protein